MSTYKHGSQNLSHENATLSVASVQWLGIKSCDILTNGDGERDESQGLLRLKERDRKQAVRLLEKCEGLVEGEWMKELRVMLMLNMKAEMEVLGERSGGVERWVEGRLLEG